MNLPVHCAAVPTQTWYAGTDREIRGRALSDFGGKAKIGVGLMCLPPGSNTKPGHWHSMEEEHLFAVSGTATLYLDQQTFQLRPGSYVRFPAGQPAAHYLSNTGATDFEYVIIGERIEGDQVTYPRDG